MMNEATFQKMFSDHRMKNVFTYTFLVCPTAISTTVRFLWMLAFILFHMISFCGWLPLERLPLKKHWPPPSPLTDRQTDRQTDTHTHTHTLSCPKEPRSLANMCNGFLTMFWQFGPSLNNTHDKSWLIGDDTFHPNPFQRVFKSLSPF